LGLRICLADLGGDALERATTEVASVAKRGSSDVRAVATDVSKLEDVQHLKDRAYDTFGERKLSYLTEKGLFSRNKAAPRRETGIPWRGHRDPKREHSASYGV
jgi:NAD(P)-dependent dehydrogenase (short-subunit alcohol dehydrogenase family)